MVTKDLETVLLVDDTPINQVILADTLTSIDAEFLVADSAKSALEIISTVKPALILLDVNMPQMDGYELCSILKADKKTADITIIFLSGLDSVDHKIKGFELGAVDYITKPFQADEVLARVKTQLTIYRLEMERQKAQRRLEQEKKIAEDLLSEARKKLSGPLLGESTAIHKLKHQINSLANTQSHTLIESEPGCGVEYVARMIHKQSNRSSQAFIYINCSNLNHYDIDFNSPDIKSTSASKFCLAKNGTLFLDHINETPRKAQDFLVKHFHKIQEWNIRLISSSYQDLSHAVHNHEISDKFYKLIATSFLSIPQLKDRSDDIIVLANYYLHRFSCHHRKNISSIAPESLLLLSKYDWPGNIDELMNTIEAQVILCKSETLTIPEEELNKGKGIGHYHLIQKIDEGGMGEIWEVKHRLLQQPAAVKLIHSNHTDHDEIQARFLREAKAISKLHSAHTIRIFDFGTQSNGSFYYAMELLHGQDLSRMVEDSGPLPYERVLHFLSQTCFSLVEAHECGIVHRDIKPSNIFISHTNFEYDNVKVLDFGIAKEINSNDNMDLTQSRVIGTPIWMSPEAFIAEIDLTPATDIYSLACVTYWLLSKNILFESNSPITYYTRHSSETPPPIREFANSLDSSIPDEFEQLLLKSLAKDPAQRPSTKEFLETVITLQEKSPWPYQSAKNSWI